MTEAIAALAKMREPFPHNQISKLPKPTKKQTDDVKADFKKGIRCTVCGSWHHPDVVHLDYVGHAALTDRLLDVDPLWTWEPATADGIPALDRNGGMWIRLTVAGVTRLGYGAADGKSGGDAVKEVIGDALRNAAMRFGAALDLWHKGDLHVDDAEPAATALSRAEPNNTGGAVETMSQWLHRHVGLFEGFTGAEHHKALTEIADSAEYKDKKARVQNQSQDAWKKLHDAELAAFQRTDDVPF